VIFITSSKLRVFKVPLYLHFEKNQRFRQSKQKKGKILNFHRSKLKIFNSIEFLMHNDNTFKNQNTLKCHLVKLFWQQKRF
jgi:hypothetical protein